MNKKTLLLLLVCFTAVSQAQELISVGSTSARLRHSGFTEQVVALQSLRANIIFETRSGIDHVMQGYDYSGRYRVLVLREHHFRTQPQQRILALCLRLAESLKYDESLIFFGHSRLHSSESGMSWEELVRIDNCQKVQRYPIMSQSRAQ